MSIEELITYLYAPVAQIALIIGVAEVIKQLGMESRWIPLVDVALGLASGIGLYGFAMGYGVVAGIVVGLALGLSACGLFSGVKNVAGIGKGDNNA